MWYLQALYCISFPRWIFCERVCLLWNGTIAATKAISLSILQHPYGYPSFARSRQKIEFRLTLCVECVGFIYFMMRCTHIGMKRKTWQVARVVDDSRKSMNSITNYRFFLRFATETFYRDILSDRLYVCKLAQSLILLRIGKP